MSPRASARTSPALAGFFTWAALAMALVLGGCASVQVEALTQHWPADVPAAAQLGNVPFFPQEDYECGPASLAMVLQSAGVQVTPEQLVDQVYLPGRQGTLQTELLVATRRHGLPAYVLQPTVEAVLREVAAGNPVLVFQNLSLPIYPVWHYAVVTGFDRARNVLVLHSGRTAQLEMSLFAFERTWARGHYWAMVAVAPPKLPATAQPEPYAQATAALERVQPQSAGAAYATALQKWPNQPVLLLGLGNTAYAMGDLGAAAGAYQQTVQAHPDYADAWNNLAQVQLELGKLRDASAAIAKAVALGGPRLGAYQATQRTVAQKILEAK
jgi:predicted double-glycine peptidase